MKIPLQKISDSLLASSKVNLYMLRLDLIPGPVSGNKFFKLKYNLKEFQSSGASCILTFGGAFSNHIAAVAAAGKQHGIATVGIIRGEETLPLNSVLAVALDCGMKLQYVSREEYRRKNDVDFIEKLQKKYPGAFLLPEGGSNDLAVKGCSEILSDIEISFDYVCCAVGTGGTLAGLISSLKSGQTAIGFPVLKAGEFLEKDITELRGNFSPKGNWKLECDYHFGGYAKSNSELINFMKAFKERNGILLEPVYTGKMMVGLYDMIEKGKIEKGKTIIALHTGGIH